jgi:hypothetical protein
MKSLNSENDLRFSKPQMKTVNRFPKIGKSIYGQIENDFR